jgi:hypothetical protein
MGRWYLGQLKGAEERQAEAAVFAAAGTEKELTAKTGTREDETVAGAQVAVGFAAVVIYVNPATPCDTVACAVAGFAGGCGAA